MGASERAEELLAKLTAAMGASGEDRPGQHEMARAVADAIVDGHHLVVAAGTGTGKSLAYLAPALALGRKTVIATATKALQDQLATKELPFIAEHVDRPISFAVLKGRSNYLCRQRLDEALDPKQQLGLEGLDPTPGGKVSAAELTKLAEWARTTDSGDRADLAEEPSVWTWAAVSVGPRECPGASKCPRGDDCFTELARRRAATADVIVVNTHLYGLHLASGRAILPHHDVVVFDEAHEVPDIISATTGLELAATKFTNASRVIGSLISDDKLVDGVAESGDHLSRVLAEHVGRRFRQGVPAEVANVLTMARTRISEGMEAARGIEDKGNADVATRKARILTTTSALAADIDEFLSPAADAVLWVDGDAERPRLELAPLDVGVTLTELLWDPEPAGGLEIVTDRDQAPDADDDHPDTPATVILTSATIPVGLAAQLQIPPDDFVELDVGTPFDFATQGLLYCAAHMPDPRNESYGAALADELERLIRTAGGRTLALFTSYRAMNEAAGALRTRLPYKVLTQGDMPKPALVEAFANIETSCLFATMGYWQGIDIPGPALSLVTIDRIPFPRPDEPLLQARREAAGAAAFQLIDVARASMLLAQGAGRLIRTSTDRGVVAVLDPRLAKTQSYRWQLIKALPPMARTKSFDDVRAFFAQS